jgi:hypothetical protein
MNLRTLVLCGCASLATIAFAAPPSPLAVHECACGKVSAASYTWDFKGEANQIFQDIQSDADSALYHADKVQSFAQDSQISWQSHSEQLDALRQDVNDMSSRLCRLEQIRRVTDPWQQREIDRIATTVRLMIDNTADAIVFGNAHQNTLWLPKYQKYADNLYNEARTLSKSVDSAVEYANAAKTYRDLRKEMRSSS